MNVLQVQDDIAHLPQIDLEVIHHFSPGMYARELRIPAGVMLAGALHRTSHLHVLSQGQIMVNNWNDVSLLTAPYTGETKAGDKRIITALEYSVFTTFHATDLTDVDEICKRILGEEL